jgi:hypothetical protein
MKDIDKKQKFAEQRAQRVPLRAIAVELASDFRRPCVHWI